MNLGERLKEKRTAFNFTQQELADKLHVSRQTISNWEVGRSYPDIETLIRLSELFSISLDVLLKGDKKMIISLKRKNAWEVLYMVFISSLILSSLICMGINFIYTQSLTWSLIVVTGCFIAGGVGTIVRVTEKERLIKSSLLVTLLLMPLLLAIHWAVPQTELSQLLLVSGIWVVYSWVVILLWRFTSLGFWWLLTLGLFLSLLGEGGTVLLVKSDLTLVDFMLRNLIELFLTVGAIFCGLLKIDSGRMDHILAAYRR